MKGLVRNLAVLAVLAVIVMAWGCIGGKSLSIDKDVANFESAVNLYSDSNVPKGVLSITFGGQDVPANARAKEGVIPEFAQCILYIVYPGGEYTGKSFSLTGNNGIFDENLLLPVGIIKISVSATDTNNTEYNSTPSLIEIIEGRKSYIDLVLRPIIPKGGLNINITIEDPDPISIVGDEIDTDTLRAAVSAYPAHFSTISNSTDVLVGRVYLNHTADEEIYIPEVDVKFINLFNAGEDQDIRNVRIIANDNIVGSSAIVCDEHVNISVDTTIPTIYSVVLDIVADIGNVDVQTAYLIYLDEKSIVGVGVVSGKMYQCWIGSKHSAGFIIIPAGIGSAFSYSIPQNVAVGMSGTTSSPDPIQFFVSHEDAKVERISFTRSGGRDSDFSWVQLYKDGVQVGCDSIVAHNHAIFYFLSEELILLEGWNLLEIKYVFNGINNGVVQGDAPYWTIESDGVEAIGANSGKSIMFDNLPLNTAPKTLYSTVATAKVDTSIACGGSIVPNYSSKVIAVAITNNGSVDLEVASIHSKPIYTGNGWDASNNTPKWEDWNHEPFGGNVNIVPSFSTKTFYMILDTTTMEQGDIFYIEIEDIRYIPSGGDEVEVLIKGMPLTGPVWEF